LGAGGEGNTQISPDKTHLCPAAALSVFICGIDKVAESNKINQ